VEAVCLSMRRVLLACVGLFVVLEGAAMALYPGGTWWDPSAQGHRFWQNFICDLEWRVALDGRPNPVGSALAQAAMVVLVAGFVPFWWAAPAWTRAVRTLAVVGVGGMLAVALMPSERFGSMHGVAVIFAAVPSIAATSLAAAGEWRVGRRIAAGVGAALLGVAALDLTLYARTMRDGGPGPVALPALQKIALGLLLTWMTMVAARRPRSRPPLGSMGDDGGERDGAHE
jgi:hypothetical protein